MDRRHITIFPDQGEWIDEHEDFNLSQFVQRKLYKEMNQ